MPKLLLKILLVLGGMFCAFACRYYVLGTQFEVYGKDVPFTLESALQFRLTRMVAEEGGIPRHDPNVQYPEGIDPQKTYSLGAEYVYSAVASLLPDNWSLANRIRFSALLLYALGVPFLGLYAYRVTGSRLAGVVTCLMYCVAPAAIIRSYGLELSRENLAIPCMFLFLYSDATARQGRQSLSGKAHRFLAAIWMGLSVVFWDLSQFLLALWAVGTLASEYVSRSSGEAVERSPVPCFSPWPYLLGLILAGSFHPYLRSHGFLIGPFVALMVGWTLQAHLFRKQPPVSRILRRVWLGLPLLAVVVSILAGPFFGARYGHFSELLLAKIQFLNIKPENPALLSYDARILWTPALHSATWGLVFSLFPAGLISLISILVLARKDFRLRNPAILFTLLGLLITFPAFVFFVRFHVFTVMFHCLILGWLAAWMVARKDAGFMVALTALVITLALEFAGLIRNPESWGRYADIKIGKQSYQFDKELTAWLGKYGENRPVLAGFGISGSILTYAKCPIILHPKFEDEVIRQRVREYGEALFKGDEATLRDFMDRMGATYLVFSPGEFFPGRVTEQMRYMVDAVHPAPEAVANKLNLQIHDSFHAEKLQQPRKLPFNFLRYFKYVWGNGKYGVFTVLSQEDEDMASEMLEFALSAFNRQDYPKAKDYILLALQYDPNLPEAYTILAQLEKIPPGDKAPAP